MAGVYLTAKTGFASIVCRGRSVTLHGMSNVSQFVDERCAASQVKNARTVLLIDDSDFERVIIRAAVEGLTEFRVCGEASNGVEGIEKAKELRPDLVVMDLSMPLMNGLEAATVLKNTLPGIPIVLLTLHTDQIHGPRSAAFGVAVVLSKVDGLAPLVRCLERLLGGNRTLPHPDFCRG